MPKPSLHVLLWSEEHQHYELYTSGHLQQRFGPEDEQLWQDWLINHTSFAFQGQAGHVSVIKEVRPRGSGYWYAYSTRGRQTSKRYLGRTSALSLTRLEEKALALTSESTPAFNVSLQTKRADLDGVCRGERGVGWMGGPLWSPAEPPASRKAEPRGLLLVETRLHHPRLPSTLVTRGRLLQALDTVLEHRLTLLSASAGSGKTTLLSAWAAASSHHVAWLSLDELDNDSTRFWASVIAALRTFLPQIAEVALAMLYSPQPPPLSTILTLLLNEVTACSSELILILDDYHVIEDQAIHDSLIFFLEHLPANLHLVLSSRVDPGLPLSRWRMQGQMAEMRDTDLCFTQEEAIGFLTQAMGLSLSEEEVVMLERRTEGWIAGLQLAALAMRKREDLSAFIKTFAGSHRYLLDYVVEEILQRQPISIQRFLLQTAVLSRMNAALCQAVTAEPQLQTSQQRLEFLERANLFVVPLDEQRQWYRFHSLFREVLLVRLQASQPEQVPLLHQRAARWYEAQGYVHEAMAHALAARDYSFAAEVLERAVEQLWMNGEAKTASTWVMALPDTILREHIDFALTSALNLLYSAQNMPEQQWAEALAQSEQMIARVEHARQSERNTPLSEADEARFHNRIRLLRGLVEMRAAFREGWMQQVRSIAHQIQPLVVEEQVAWKWIPMYGLFVSAQLLGDSVLLLPELLALKQQALQEQDRYTAIVVMCWLAAAFLYGGHLRLLQQECLQVQDLLEQLDCQISVAAYPSLDLSFLFYAWNQLEEAEICLQKVMRHARHWQDTNLLVWCYCTYVKVFLTSGRVAEAEQTLQEVQHLIQRTGFTVYDPEVTAAQASLWLAQGNLSAAGAWATHFVFNPDVQEYIREEEYLALARVYLAQQQYEQCLQLLAQLLSRMEQVERRWDIIHILALQVAALQVCGEVTQARQVAVRLLTLTESEGYIRVYLDAGEPMRQVLQALLDAPDEVVSLSYVSTLLAAFEQEERKRALPAPQAGFLSPRQGTLLPARTHDKSGPYGLDGHAPLQSASPATQLLEPLTPREQEVLRLLAAGTTNQEIANRLVVSLTTVKKHVGNILMKLAAENRTHAVTRARELSLL